MICLWQMSLSRWPAAAAFTSCEKQMCDISAIYTRNQTPSAFQRVMKTVYRTIFYFKKRYSVTINQHIAHLSKYSQNNEHMWCFFRLLDIFYLFSFQEKWNLTQCRCNCFHHKACTLDNTLPTKHSIMYSEHKSYLPAGLQRSWARSSGRVQLFILQSKQKKKLHKALVESSGRSRSSYTSTLSRQRKNGWQWSLNLRGLLYAVKTQNDVSTDGWRSRVRAFWWDRLTWDKERNKVRAERGRVFIRFM